MLPSMEFNEDPQSPLSFSQEILDRFAKRGPEVMQGLELILKNKPEVLDCLCKSALPMSENILGYIEDMEVRLEIWHQFERTAENLSMKLNATALGVTMVAPLWRLREISAEMRDVHLESSQLDRTVAIIHHLTETSATAMRDCMSMNILSG